MTDTPVLKPCGHCGEQCADLIIDQGDKWAHYSASCLEVRTGYNLSSDAPWRAEAIAAYNKRQPTQSDAVQADIDAMESILWVDTIIDDKEAIAKAFACHRDYGYDRGYYDGCEHTMDAEDALRDALADLLHAVCGKTGFAETVRRDSGRIYPWPALDLAEAKAIAALEQSK